MGIDSEANAWKYKDNELDFLIQKPSQPLDAKLIQNKYIALIQASSLELYEINPLGLTFNNKA